MGKTVNELQEECHKIAVQNGFWDDPRNNAEMIALMHSELSEALEADREGNLSGKDGVAEELADTVIRILDFCEGRDIDLQSEILGKIAINRDREYKHGKEY